METQQLIHAQRKMVLMLRMHASALTAVCLIATGHWLGGVGCMILFFVDGYYFETGK